MVVVGGGVAGLYAALCAAAEADVLLLTKGVLFSSNSYLAHGGVAAALGAGDDPGLHAADTLTAGRGLCRARAVAVLTSEAAARIADLVDLGVGFDEGLAREGGHSRRRVVHAGGAETGKNIAEALAERVRAHARITVSVLECLVFGRRAALAALAEPEPPARSSAPAPAGDRAAPPRSSSELWKHAGLIRSAEGLQQLLGSPSLLVRLVAQSALVRAESRGAHFRADHPFEDEAFAGHIVLRRGEEPVLARWS